MQHSGADWGVEFTGLGWSPERHNPPGAQEMEIHAVSPRVMQAGSWPLHLWTRVRISEWYMGLRMSCHIWGHLTRPWGPVATSEDLSRIPVMGSWGRLRALALCLSASFSPWLGSSDVNCRLVIRRVCRSESWGSQKLNGLTDLGPPSRGQLSYEDALAGQKATPAFHLQAFKYECSGLSAGGTAEGNSKVQELQIQRSS